MSLRNIRDREILAKICAQGTDAVISGVDLEWLMESVQSRLPRPCARGRSASPTCKRTRCRGRVEEVKNHAHAPTDSPSESHLFFLRDLNRIIVRVSRDFRPVGNAIVDDFVDVVFTDAVSTPIPPVEANLCKRSTDHPCLPIFLCPVRRVY